MATWREITSVDEWKQLYEKSAEQPVLLLKHSTTCPVSANALKEYEAYLSKDKTAVDYVLVKVIESRPVSNQIAEDLNIKHESPQIIYLKNKFPEWNASHWAVTVEHISAVLD
ncbi:bacillithiol system redox-active protein YtxJ [Marinicrinis lubricantis]|uniref:Bacillithiol system redox-active protein YtxJ n=1 Tax=Marinicrinis lubricantis TaxID=2086470 RepID=A0ABW1INM7_9BACL